MGVRCSTCTNKRFARIKKTLLCREKTQSSYKLYNAEQNDNINLTFSIEESNDTAVTIVTVPSQFITINDFITRWFSWKNEFLLYLQNIAETNTLMCGTLLLDLMGPIGKEIHKTFRFYDNELKEDVDILIKKFDIYCLYGNTKKEDKENIDMYINQLKHFTFERNYPDPTSIMKEKIIQDIRTQQFIGEAESFVKSQGKNLISYLRTLSFNDVILFWKQCENLMPQSSSGDLTPQKDCKDLTPQKNSKDALRKTSICTKEAQLSNKSFNAEKNDNINTTFSKKNNDTIITIPPKFNTKKDFVTTWFLWKYEFLIYLKNLAETNQQTLGIMLLNLMGPVGKEIHKTFRFYDDQPEEDLDVLMKKFDIYCLYGNTKRRDNEDIDSYINKLKHATLSRNYPDAKSIMKEKIIQDIRTQRFLGEAESFVKSRGENLTSYLRTLNVNDIILFWKQCEKLMPQNSFSDLTPQKRFGDSTSQKDCNSSMSQKNNESTLQKTLTCTQNVQLSYESCNAEKNDNINVTSSKKNNDTTIAVPSKFNTKDDFVSRWFSWKNEFLTYLKNVDLVEANQQTSGIMLLDLMGPIGIEIHRTFRFYDNQPGNNIDVLMKKFDIYCIYGNMKKGDNENIDIYINKLEHVTLTQNCTDPMSIMKEKIIQDIRTQQFLGEAAFFIKRRGKNLISYLRTLDINDVILFWKQCEDLMPHERYEEFLLQKRCKDLMLQEDCKDLPLQKRCENLIPKKISKKMPQQNSFSDTWCNICKQFGHSTNSCCKVKSIDICNKCGTSHIQSRCPAYGKLCTKCGKKNHFTSKCQSFFGDNYSRCSIRRTKSPKLAQKPKYRRRHRNRPNHSKNDCVKCEKYL